MQKFLVKKNDLVVGILHNETLPPQLLIEAWSSFEAVISKLELFTGETRMQG